MAHEIDATAAEPDPISLEYASSAFGDRPAPLPRCRNIAPMGAVIYVVALLFLVVILTAFAGPGPSSSTSATAVSGLDVFIVACCWVGAIAGVPLSLTGLVTAARCIQRKCYGVMFANVIAAAVLLAFSIALGFIGSIYFAIGNLPAC